MTAIELLEFLTSMCETILRARNWRTRIALARLTWIFMRMSRGEIESLTGIPENERQVKFL